MARGGGLVNFFKQREQCVGIGINWLCFDGGGHETMPKSGYVVENYTRAYKGQSAYRTCGFKSVVQPRQVTCAGVHHCEYRLLKKAANERARPLQMAWDYSFDTKSRSAELIQINHYYTKSKEEYLEKINVRKYGWKSESQQKTYNETDWAFPEWEADDSMKEAAAALRAKGVPETYSANSF